MSRLPYPIGALLLMLAMALLFHILAVTTEIGIHLPILAPYIVAFLVALHAILNYHFMKKAQQSDDKRLMNVILISKIVRMFFFLLIFLVYCFVVDEKIKGFEVELICMFFAYIFFDVVYLLRMHNKQKKGINE